MMKKQEENEEETLMIIDFNKPEKPVIIGLDHGYGNVKTAHACFQTGVTRHDREPTFKSNLRRYTVMRYGIPVSTE